MTDTVQDGTLRTRRSLLTAAAGGAAALAVSAIRPTGAAAAPANMQTETDNATIAATGVSNSTADVDALFGNASGDGTGVKGTSVTGKALYGASTDVSDPANNVEQAGVVGVAGNIANAADNFGLSGVYGWADESPVDGFVGTGVWGDSVDIGLVGTGATGLWANGGWGVRALTGNGVGVYTTADSIAGLALRAIGRAEFSRSGRTIVKAGNAKKVVTLAGCTGSSLVIAVLAQNRSGRYVRAAVPEAGKFTIYLNQSVGSDTKVSWIVFTNPSNHSG